MELYFNMFKIRYLVLDDIMKNVKFSPGEEINIFINLETILKKVAGQIEDRENILEGPRRNLILSSCIFNLAAHYRNYFNKHKVCSKVYIFGPEKVEIDYLNRVYIENYRTDSLLLNRDTLTSIGNTYMKCMPYLQTIISYVEGVYFISSGIMEPSIIPKIINKIRPENKHNVLITDDQYDYQYIKDDYIILKPRLEKSIMIDKNNIMDVLKNKTKCRNVENPDVNFLPYILAVLGDAYRGITKIKGKGISKIYKEINKGIKDHKISKDTTNIMSLLEIVEPENENQTTINYLTTNVDEQFKRLSESNINYIKEQLIDRYDSGYLKEVNDEFFIEYPLNIIEITRGIKKSYKINWRL